jgi:hypothetical protein
MTKARMDGFYLMLLGTVAFLLFGIVMMRADRHVPLFDYRTAYYSGQCLLHRGCDPFSEHDIGQLYAQRVESGPVGERDLTVITRNIYLPSAFVLTVPLALIPFDFGQTIWMLLITASTILAAFLMWSASASRAPILCGALLCFLLANSSSLLFFGNPAGFVVPLCVLAAWCFINERWIQVGIASLTVGLVFKPHDVGLVWLFFLMAGGLYRRRALQTLALFAALVVPTILWVQHISPNWLQELSANLQVGVAKGGMNYPGEPHSTCTMINMQTVTSFFWENPHAYNLASYLICAPFLLIWIIATVRSRPSLEKTWFGLAAIAPLSMLPVYHRQYDAKLMILAIPALAILCARRDQRRWLGIVVTSAAFVLNGDFPWAIYYAVAGKLHLSTQGDHGRLLIAALDFPIPLSLLAMSAFYLWIYVRHPAADAAMDRTIAPEYAPAASVAAS